MASTLKILIHW